jgi:hypothetical protein
MSKKKKKEKKRKEKENMRKNRKFMIMQWRNQDWPEMFEEGIVVCSSYAIYLYPAQFPI